MPQRIGAEGTGARRNLSGRSSTANWSVIASSFEWNRKTVAGRPPWGPGSRRSPVSSSSSRRTRTRWRFVAETSCPSATVYRSRSSGIVKVGGASAKPRFVYESFARSRSRPARTISPWSKAIAAGVDGVPRRVVGDRRVDVASARARGRRWRAAVRRGAGGDRSTFRAAPGATARGRRPSRRDGAGSTPRASRGARGSRREGPRRRLRGRARAARAAPGARRAAHLQHDGEGYMGRMGGGFQL